MQTRHPNARSSQDRHRRAPASVSAAASVFVTAFVLMAANPLSPRAAADTKADRGSSKSASAADKLASRDSAGRLITLDYVNAEVTDVIRALSAQSGVNVAVSPNVKGEVTVHLRGKTVDEAMLMVANLAGLGAKKVSDTYVVAPRTDMKTTLERMGASRTVALEHMTPQAAVDLAQNSFPDLTARPQGKAVTLVGANDDLDGAAALIHQNDVFNADDVHTVEKVKVSHMQVVQAATALVKMDPGLAAEPAGDSLVLTGTKHQVDAAKQGLALIDVPARPDFVTQVYSIKYGKAAQLVALVQRAVPEVQAFPGIESTTIADPQFTPITSNFAGFNTGQSSSSSSSTQPGGAGAAGMAGGMGPAGELLGPSKGMLVGNALTILLRGAPEAVDEAMRLLTLIDVPPRQVMIEAKVVETSPSLTSNIGVDWNWSPFNFFENPAGTAVSQSSSSSGAGGSGSGSSTSSFTTRPLGFGAFSRMPWSFVANLNASIVKGDAKLLANPSIAAVNDQDATIFIGDTLRFQSLAQSSPTTGNQFTVVEVPVGIILLVHPRINDDGNITMKVHPVVSSLTGINNGLPQTSSREAETTVRVKDGDTLVIGGLIQDNDIKSLSKIPFLGDLPLLGYLFRSYSRQHNRTEIMIVLTIHLLKS